MYEELLLPLKEPVRLWSGLWIVSGFYMLGYLYNMCYYEWKYEKGGENFMKFGKDFFKNEVPQEI